MRMPDGSECTANLEHAGPSFLGYSFGGKANTNQDGSIADTALKPITPWAGALGWLKDAAKSVLGFANGGVQKVFQWDAARQVAGAIDEPNEAVSESSSASLDKYVAGYTENIPADDKTGRMAIDAKVFGVSNGKASVGWAGGTGPLTNMPVESLPHFFADLSGKVNLPADSGHPVIDAIASGKGDYLGKGQDGVVFGVGDKVAKISTTVPYQPFNPGHRTPQEAKDLLRAEVERNNKLFVQLGGKGVLPQEYREHGDKAFAIRDRLDLPKDDKFTAKQVQRVRHTMDAIHDAGHVLGDTVQVGLKKGQPYLFDLGQARDVSADPPTWQKDYFDDDSSAFGRFATKAGHEELAKPLAKTAANRFEAGIESVQAIKDDPEDLAFHRACHGEWLNTAAEGLKLSGRFTAQHAKDFAEAKSVGLTQGFATGGQARNSDGTYSGNSSSGAMLPPVAGNSAVGKLAAGVGRFTRRTVSGISHIAMRLMGAAELGEGSDGGEVGDGDAATPQPQPPVIHSDAFKKWFGDWKNDPENASKVIDEDGRPKVVYHGSDDKRDEFKEGNSPGVVGFFSESKGKLGEGKFGDETTESFLSITNPFDSREMDTGIRGKGRAVSDWKHHFKANGIEWDEFDFGENANFKDTTEAFHWSFLDAEKGLVGSDNNVVDVLKKHGFDGVRATEEGHETWAAFNPTQIKSATGNRGTFDPDDPRIGFAAGGTPDSIATGGAVQSTGLAGLAMGGNSGHDSQSQTQASPTDTIPALLTPGEVVLNKGQQGRLESITGTPAAKLFGMAGVPGFADGGEAGGDDPADASKRFEKLAVPDAIISHKDGIALDIPQHDDPDVLPNFVASDQRAQRRENILIERNQRLSDFSANPTTPKAGKELARKADLFEMRMLRSWNRRNDTLPPEGPLGPSGQADFGVAAIPSPVAPKPEGQPSPLPPSPTTPTPTPTLNDFEAKLKAATSELATFEKSLAGRDQKTVTPEEKESHRKLLREKNDAELAARHADADARTARKRAGEAKRQPAATSIPSRLSVPTSSPPTGWGALSPKDQADILATDPKLAKSMGAPQPQSQPQSQPTFATAAVPSVVSDPASTQTGRGESTQTPATESLPVLERDPAGTDVIPTLKPADPRKWTTTGKNADGSDSGLGQQPINPLPAGDDAAIQTRSPLGRGRGGILGTVLSMIPGRAGRVARSVLAGINTPTASGSGGSGKPPIPPGPGSPPNPPTPPDDDDSPPVPPGPGSSVPPTPSRRSPGRRSPSAGRRTTRRESLNDSLTGKAIRGAFKKIASTKLGKQFFASGVGRAVGKNLSGLARTTFGRVAINSTLGGLAGGPLGSVGGAAGSLIGGAAGASVGLAATGVGAIVAVISKINDAANALRGFAQQTAEANRSLGTYNGAITAAFARLDVARIGREKQMGQYTAKSNRMLTEAVNEAEQARMPLRQIGGDVGNIGGFAAAKLSAQLDKILTMLVALSTLPEILQFIKWAFGQKDEDQDLPPAEQAVADWMGGDPRGEMKKWAQDKEAADFGPKARARMIGDGLAAMGGPLGFAAQKAMDALFGDKKPLPGKGGK